MDKKKRIVVAQRPKSLKMLLSIWGADWNVTWETKNLL